MGPRGNAPTASNTPPANTPRPSKLNNLAVFLNLRGSRSARSIPLSYHFTTGAITEVPEFF
jgi:hypothetical protein